MPDSGTIEWGKTVKCSYMPQDNTEYFNRDEELIVNARTLFCLLQNAVILDLFNEKWDIVANNENLRKNVYGHLYLACF